MNESEAQVPYIFVSEAPMTDDQLHALRNSTREIRADFQGTIPGINDKDEIDESVWVPVQMNDVEVARLTINGRTEVIYAWC